MAKKKSRQEGFILVFVLVFASTLSLSAFYLVGTFSSGSRDQLKLNVTNSAQMIRNHVHNLVLSRTAWANTVADVGNVQMACLRPVVSDCTGGVQYNFRLRDATNAIIFDPTPGTSGFRADGTICNTFNDLVGNDDCPFSLTLTWEAMCGVPDTGPGEGPVSYSQTYGCKEPVIRVRSNIKYHPANIGLQVGFNANTFSETFDFSAKQVAAAAGVAGYMVKWTAAREMGPSTIWADPAGSRVGIGTAAPALPFEVIRDSRNPAGRHTASFEAYSGTPNVNSTTGVSIGSFNTTNNYANAVYSSIQAFSPNGGGRDLFINPAGGNVVMATSGVPDVSTNGLRIQGNFAIDGNDPFTLVPVRAYRNAPVVWNIVSDRRLKKNIRPFDSGIEEILNLHPKFFKYNGLAGTPNDGKDHIGLIAQDVEKHFPYMVSHREVRWLPKDRHTTSVRSLDPGPVTFLILNAVKDLSMRVESEIRRQVSRLASLEKRIHAEEIEVQSLLQKASSLKAGTL